MKQITMHKAMEVFSKSNGKCVYCGNQAEVIDHMQPRLYGGSSRVENLVPACSDCNSIKRAHDLSHFRTMLHFHNLGLRGMPKKYHERLYELGIAEPQVVFFREDLLV